MRDQIRRRVVSGRARHARVRRALAALGFVSVVGARASPVLACSSDSDCPFLSTCDMSVIPATCTTASSSSGPVHQGDVALVTSSIGIGLSVFGLIGGLVVWDRWWKERTPDARQNATVGLFTIGSIMLATGGVSVALQATTSDPCPFKSPCQITYGFSGTMLSIGTLFTAMGLYVVASPAASARRRALVLPVVPTVSPRPHGATFALAFPGADFF